MTPRAPTDVETQPPAPHTAAPAGPEFLPPLRPRKKLFAVLSLVFALWVATLIGMYVRWVWPERRAADAPSTRVTE